MKFLRAVATVQWGPMSVAALYTMRAPPKQYTEVTELLTELATAH